MSSYLVLPAIVVVALILDYIWIAKIANGLYLQAFQGFGRIVDGQFVPILWAAAVVYLIIPAAVYVFVVSSSGGQSYGLTLLKGGFLGFCLYGVYDFTNLATIQNWTLRLSLIDVAWGIFLCAVLSLFGKFLLERAS